MENGREKEGSFTEMYIVLYTYTVYIVYTSNLTHCTCTMYMYKVMYCTSSLATVRESCSMSWPWLMLGGISDWRFCSFYGNTNTHKML